MSNSRAKGLRQNATGEVKGGWKEASDGDVQKLCSTKHNYESKHDKMGVTGIRKQEIHTQTFAMLKRRWKENIKIDLKSKRYGLFKSGPDRLIWLAFLDGTRGTLNDRNIFYQLGDYKLKGKNHAL